MSYKWWPFCFDSVTSVVLRSECDIIQKWDLFIMKVSSLSSSSISQSLWSTKDRFYQLIRGCVAVLWWGRNKKKKVVLQFWDNLMSCSLTHTTNAHPKRLPSSSSPSQYFTRVTLRVAFPAMTQWRHGASVTKQRAVWLSVSVCGLQTMMGC